MSTQDTFVRRTSRKRRTPLLGGAFFILLLAAMLAVTMPSVVRGARPTMASVVNGEWMRSVDVRLERLHPLRRLGFIAWFRIDCTLLQDCPIEEGVVLREPPSDRVTYGKNDWLFLGRELDHVPTSVEQNVDALIEAIHAFEATGTRVIVALVPMKVRLASRYLPDGFVLRDALASQYSDTLERFARNGILAPDLLASMRAANEPFREHELYLRQDTHWAPMGSFEAAKPVAEQIRRLLNEQGVQPVPYRIEWGAEARQRANLARLIGLHTTETFRTFQAIRDSEDVDGQQDTVLVGTSYSQPRFRFGDALRFHAQAEIVNVAQNGQGFWRPFIDYVNGEQLMSDSPAILVWEIPERHLGAIPPFADMSKDAALQGLSTAQ